MGLAWRAAPDEIEEVKMFQQVSMGIPHYHGVLRMEPLVNSSNFWFIFDCCDLATYP
jgi:hypothetical protein